MVAETAELRLHAFSGKDEHVIVQVDNASKETASRMEHLTRERDEAKYFGAESREQLGAILCALELVLKLAAMDCTTYYTSHFSGGNACRFKTQNPKEKDSDLPNTSISTVIANIKSTTRLSKEKDDSEATPLHAKFAAENVNKGDGESSNQHSDSNYHHNQQHCIRKEHDVEDNECSDYNASTIQSRLDELKDQWKLEQTPILKITSSIHRLQSHLYHVQNEADIAMSQVRSLNYDVVKYKKRNDKLEKVVKNLHKSNTNLKSRLKETKNAKKCFVNSVKDYVKRKRVEELDKEELHVATRLTIHEKLLQMNRASTKYRNGTEKNLNAHECKSLREILRDEEDATLQFYSGCSRQGDEENKNYDRHQDFPLIGNRIRTSTSESVYSELDPSFDSAYCNDHDGLSDEPSRVLKNSGESYEPFYDDSKSCSASTWSVRSLITDECTGTVRLLDSSSSSSIADHSNDHDNDNGNDNDNDNETGSSKSYSPFNILTFPRGLDVGLQFQTLPLHQEEAPVVEDFSDFTCANRSRSFSDGAMLNLSGPDKIPYKSPSAVHFNKSFFAQSSSEVEETQDIFVVSGFKGFDTTLNKKPAIGDQLIAIGNETLLDGNWSIDDMKQAIEQMSSSPPTDASGSFTMTFRNDPCIKSQKIALDKAMNAVENRELITDESSVKFSSVNKTITKKDKSKPSFFELFKSSSSSDATSLSQVGKEKKPSLSFFALTSLNKNEMGLNSSKRSLTTLSELDVDDDDAKNDRTNISKSNGNAPCVEPKLTKNEGEKMKAVVLSNDESSPLPESGDDDGAQQHRSKSKSSDTLFFGIFSSSKKKEKGTKKRISKVSREQIPTSETSSSGELCVSKKGQELNPTDKETENNEDESQTLSVDCDKRSKIKHLKVSPETPSLVQTLEEGYKEAELINPVSCDDEGRKIETQTSEEKHKETTGQELVKKCVTLQASENTPDICKYNSIELDGSNSNSNICDNDNDDELPPGPKPIQTLGLQFITLF